MDKKIRFKSLQIEGAKYKTLLNTKFQNRKKWEAPDKKKITSFIPGTIVKTFVKQGDKVKIGDNILVLEAMKMLNKVTTDVNGKIKKINAKKGQRVAKGDILIEFE